MNKSKKGLPVIPSVISLLAITCGVVDILWMHIFLLGAVLAVISGTVLALCLLDEME